MIEDDCYFLGVHERLLACKAVGVFCNANDDILGANGSAILDVDTDITESWCESKMISKKGTG